MRYSNRDCGMAADEELWDTAHQRGMRAAEWAEIEASLALGELPVDVAECPL